MPQTERILVAPLNWGLGHATRCIPIINYLLEKELEVIIASEGRALQLLRQEFPQLLAIELPAYRIRYHSSNMFFNIAWQIPKILRAIFQEYRFTQKLIQQYNIRAIISDNRFGCYSKQAYSIFITHQLNIKIPFSPLESIVNFFNHRFINKFDTCWVPDSPAPPRLAGDLSRPSPHLNLHYLGPMSRMIKQSNAIRRDGIVVLSGPEPQRTKLEEKLLRQMEQIPLSWLLVRGIPENTRQVDQKANIKIINFLNSKALNQAIEASKFVVCRSGYSSIMDLSILQKKAIFIPTPGQTEQEYLAQSLAQQGMAVVQSQSQLNLKNAVKALDKVVSIKQAQAEDELLKAAVQDLLHHLRLN